MAGFIDLKLTGVETVNQILSVADKFFGNQELLWQAVVRETRLPNGSGPIIPNRYTLEGSVQEAFERGGANTYGGAWLGLWREPNYRAYKDRKGGGSRMLIWDGSRDPMFASFLDRRHPEHIEEVTSTGVRWGSSMTRASRLSAGGFTQRWDRGVVVPARPIVRFGSKGAAQLAKGGARLLLDRVRGAKRGVLGRFGL